MPETTQQTRNDAIKAKLVQYSKDMKSNGNSREVIKTTLTNILVGLACPKETTDVLIQSQQDRGHINDKSKGIADNASGEADFQKISDKKARPTYNVRTPYVSIEINGIQIHESPYKGQLLNQGVNDDGTTWQSYPEYNSSFKALNLTAPMGGEVGTISGSAEILTKDPVNFLQAIFYPQGDTTDASFGGMPIATVKYGWTCATGEVVDGNEDGVVQVVSNPIKLMIRDFSLGDISTLGVTVKLELQDTGSVLTGNSAGGGCCLAPDYPQEQLRVLLERYLKLRLFTLDDFYYFDESNSGIKAAGTNTSETTFVNPVNNVIRLNSDLLFYAIELLVSIIKERLSFFNNKDFVEVTKASTSSNMNFVTAVKQLKEINNQKTVDTKATEQENKNKTAKIKELVEKINKSQEDLVYGCNLVWVPTIPQGWKTTSGYAGEPNEDGAYVLMPDPSSLPDVYSELLPVNYGPGGSSYPYLFASAQNLINFTENPSATWGDVIGMNLKYTSLIAQMLGDGSETQSFASDTERLSSYSPKLNKTPQEVTSTGRVFKTNTKPQVGFAATKEAAKQNAENEQAKMRNLWTPRNKALRFKGSVAGRNTNKADDPKTSEEAFGGNEAKEAAKNRSCSNMEKYSSSNAMLRLKRKVSNFMAWPHEISITVLGDPSLMHQAVGMFELLAYYPIETKEGTSVDHMYNHFISGMYMVQVVTHNITATGFTSELQGLLINPVEAAYGMKAQQDADGNSTIENSIGLVTAIDAAASVNGRDKEFQDLVRISAEDLPELVSTSVDTTNTFVKILEMYKARK